MHVRQEMMGYTHTREISPATNSLLGSESEALRIKWWPEDLGEYSSEKPFTGILPAEMSSRLDSSFTRYRS